MMFSAEKRPGHLWYTILIRRFAGELVFEVVCTLSLNMSRVEIKKFLWLC